MEIWHYGIIGAIVVVFKVVLFFCCAAGRNNNQERSRPRWGFGHSRSIRSSDHERLIIERAATAASRDQNRPRLKASRPWNKPRLKASRDRNKPKLKASRDQNRLSPQALAALSRNLNRPSPQALASGVILEVPPGYTLGNDPIQHDPKQMDILPPTYDEVISGETNTMSSN